MPTPLSTSHQIPPTSGGDIQVHSAPWAPLDAAIGYLRLISTTHLLLAHPSILFHDMVMLSQPETSCGYAVCEKDDLVAPGDVGNLLTVL